MCRNFHEIVKFFGTKNKQMFGVISVGVSLSYKSTFFKIGRLRYRFVFSDQSNIVII